MNFRRTAQAVAGMLVAVCQPGCSILCEAASEDVTSTRPVDAATIGAAVRRAPGDDVLRIEPPEPYRVFFLIPRTRPEFIEFTDWAAPTMLGWRHHAPGSAQVSVTGRYGNQRPADRERTAALNVVRRVVRQLRQAADGQ